MKAPVQYREHVGIMADFYNTFSGGSTDTELLQDFETIYENALDVGYGEAKRYLAGLDAEEMETIRAFHHLADGIDIGTLDEEGAYNLLVHNYEQLDLNDDGLIQSGAADLMAMFPQDMPNGLKSALVKTYGQMQDEGLDYFRDISPIMIQLYFKYNAQHLTDQLKEATGRDDIRIAKADYSYRSLLDMQESMHHPKGGAVVSEHHVKMFDRFMEILGGILGEEACAATAGEATKNGDEDTQVASFFDRVRAAGGALNFIQKMNLEKIEKLIEEKRKELEGKLGVNAKPPLPPEQLAKVLEQIEALLAEYKKDLLEDMEKRSGSLHFDKDAFLKQLINAPSEEETVV